MSTIKPRKVDVDCVFKCPQCTCEKWYTTNEIQNYRNFVCDCGYTCKFEPIKSIKIIYKNIDEENMSASGYQKKASQTHLPDMSKFVDMLVSMGFKKKDAKATVNSYKSEYTNDEEFAQKLINAISQEVS